MKKIILFSLFLLAGLILSQIVPGMAGDNFDTLKFGLDTLLYIALAYIMINVGREFELDKTQLKSYRDDYLIAMATAALPWLFVSVYFMCLMPKEMFSSWDAWKESLLLSRFAAPTSAGILFTMLAAAGLKKAWIYKKIEVLAIFDDLDTILLMIPLQIFMIGMKWQLAVVIAVVFWLLWLGWKKLNHYDLKQSWPRLLFYSLLIVILCQGIYFCTKYFFGIDSAIHIEVLLPAFVLGMTMRNHHDQESPKEKKVSTVVSYVFMLLVGLSTPLFVGIDLSEPPVSDKITANLPMMDWGAIGIHVLVVTLISNIGKLFPVFFYRDRSLYERFALSIGMFTRGEVGAGIIFIAIGYRLGGPLLIIALLSLVLNLVLTGLFVIIVKQLALKAYGNRQEESPDVLSVVPLEKK